MLKRMELKLQLRQSPLQPHKNTSCERQGEKPGGLKRLLSTSCKTPGDHTGGHGSQYSTSTSCETQGDHTGGHVSQYFTSTSYARQDEQPGRLVRLLSVSCKTSGDHQGGLLRQSSCKRPGEQPRGLVRQLSTSSLPSKQLGINRLRLSYSGLQKRAQPLEAELSNNVAQLPDQYSDLKILHADFEQFLNVVVEDLKEKVDKLRRFKALERTGQERSYTSLQLFMMSKYSSRIQSFRLVSSLSIENICVIHNQTPAVDISSLVNKVHKDPKNIDNL